jgi:hypothetical protein
VLGQRVLALSQREFTNLTHDFVPANQQAADRDAAGKLAPYKKLCTVCADPAFEIGP